VHYALDYRNGDERVRKVFLIQRPRDASIMAGMWEFPELPASSGEDIPSFTLRHSITVTNYTVRVWRVAAPLKDGGEWVPLEHLPRLALTGLARKILRRAQLL
jgi:A/G-specific adenine glycosylase